jgi:DNA-binding transcriptional LysR family regulator
MPMANPILNWEPHVSRRFKLRELHILFTVVHWGSMAKGATQLGMSQPAVSEAIASLEGTLGVRLLDRNARGVEPTIYARALLKRGAVIFDELKQGFRDIEFLTHPTAGEIRIGAPESLMDGFVPAVIDRLSQQYPKVSVSVTAAQPGEQEFRELRERSVDLLLGRLFNPVSDDDIAVDVLRQDAFRVVAGAGSQWSRQRKNTLAELVNERWISFPTNSVVNSYLEEGFRAHGVELPKPSITTFSTQVRLHLLKTGRFLTILHDSVLAFNTEQWSFKVLPINLFVRPMPITIFSLKNRTVSPVVQLFIEQAHEIAKSIVKSPNRRTTIAKV